MAKKEKKVKEETVKEVKETKAKPSKKKSSAEKKIIARTVQELLDFDYITNNGIIIQGKNFSKLYSIIDSNFVTEPDDKQEDILADYTRLVNRFPDNVDISIIIINHRNTTEQLYENYHIRAREDNYDNFRNDYNGIIDTKIKEGHNDISKEKFIMLTVHARDLDEADQTFASIGIALNEATKAINKVGVKEVDAIERLSIMKQILNGPDGIPFEKEYDGYFERSVDEEENVTIKFNHNAFKKKGMSVKDTIAPQTIERDKRFIRLGEDRICSSFAYASLPPSLSTNFLTKTTNIPYEMVTVIQLKSVPRKKALNLVKMQNTSIKADVIKATQQAYRAGYDPSLMNEDLQQAQTEAKILRNDVVNEGKKLFYATMVLTIFGKDDAELKLIASQLESVCQDFNITPSYLWGQQIAGLNTALFTGMSKVIIDRMLTSDNVQALFPFNIQELQDKKGHFYGINAISKNMIMYDRKRSRLANGLIFGQSGSGKSFITKGELIPNLLDGQDDMIILDPENEYRVIAETFGGIVIDLETNSDYHINPCDMSMEWADPKAAPLVEKCDYMVGLVESILGKGRECTSYEVNVIHRATQRMYEDYIKTMRKRYDNGELNAEFDPSICPTLKNFHEELLADNSPEGNKIAMAVEPYCTGSYNLFAHRTNINTTDTRLLVFNLLYLPEKMKEMAMKVCLANIWTRVVKNREYNERTHAGKSIWVYLDEFHLFFQTESSATTIMAYFKRVRKYGGIMTGITQDVADLLKNQQGTAMFNNSGFFIFLNQSPIGRNHLQSLYGISDALIDFVKDKPSGMGLIYNNSILIPFDYKIPITSELYKIMSTNPNDEKRNKKKKELTVEEKLEEAQKEITRLNELIEKERRARYTESVNADMTAREELKKQIRDELEQEYKSKLAGFVSSDNNDDDGDGDEDESYEF